MANQINLAKELFNIAIKDLDSVMVLYNSRHYNIALFQLQQAVEKLVKSYGLRIEVIKPNELSKKINHLPQKVFTLYFRSQIEELSRRNDTPSLIPDMVPPHQRGKSNVPKRISNLQRLHDKINNTQTSEIKNVDEVDIKRFLEESKLMEIEHVFDDIELFRNFKDNFIKTNKHFKEYFKRFGADEILADVEDSLKNPDPKVRNRVSNFLHRFRQDEKIEYISFVWINLSMTTSVHEQTTRYPSINSEESPLHLYSESNPLIKYIPEFFELMKKTIIKYKEVYE